MEYAGGIRAGVNLLYSGIASLTVGSIVTGVVEIYGTTYYLLVVYSCVGVILTVLGTLVTIIALALVCLGVLAYELLIPMVS